MSSEKTEPPTQKRIRDARKMGNYFFSKEIVTASTMVTALAALGISYKWLIGFFLGALDNVLAHLGGLSFQTALAQTVTELLIFIAASAGIMYATSICTGILASIFQTGPAFSAAKLTKGLQSLNFIKNAQETFSKKRLFSFMMNIIKVFVVFLTVFLTIKHLAADFVHSVSCGFGCAMGIGKIGLGILAWIVALVFIPLAIIEAFSERHFYLKNLRMSLDEIKREFKESEGSPEIKSHRRQLHQEILQSSMGDETRKASVLVTNPTHYAIALRYDSETTPLPLIVAKGEGAIAQFLMNIAKESDVPIVQNIGLARQLYHEAELNAFIGPEFIEPVAEILLYIEQLRGEAS